jgi:hypothetical protein
MQDTLRSALPASPFYDVAAVTALLDRVPAMDPAARSALDPVVVSMLSAVHLQRAFGLTA